MLVALLMGFSCGLPLLLTLSVLQAWMKAEGVDLAIIGLMALVGLPYTLKFLWAPILDRYTLPFLGRRRGRADPGGPLFLCHRLPHHGRLPGPRHHHHPAGPGTPD